MTKYLLWDQINKNNEKLLSTQSITNQDLVRLNTNQKSNQLNRIKTDESIINQNMMIELPFLKKYTFSEKEVEKKEKGIEKIKILKIIVKFLQKMKFYES